MTGYDRLDATLELLEFIAGAAVIAAWVIGYIEPTEPIGAIVLGAALVAVFGDAALEVIGNYVEETVGEGS